MGLQKERVNSYYTEKDTNILSLLQTVFFVSLTLKKLNKLALFG